MWLKLEEILKLGGEAKYEVGVITGILIPSIGPRVDEPVRVVLYLRTGRLGGRLDSGVDVAGLGFHYLPFLRTFYLSESVRTRKNYKKKVEKTIGK